MHCIECDCPIDGNVRYYSLQYLGYPLCREHQDWIKNHQATKEAVELYFLLRKNGIPASLEKFDGHKTVDIVIEEAKVHIEVDARYHNHDQHQALSDLERAFHTFKKGYITLRIPNSLMNSKVEETANYIAGFLALNIKKQPKKRSSIMKLIRYVF